MPSQLFDRPYNPSPCCTGWSSRQQHLLALASLRSERFEVPAKLRFSTASNRQANMLQINKKVFAHQGEPFLIFLRRGCCGWKARDEVLHTSNLGESKLFSNITQQDRLQLSNNNFYSLSPRRCVDSGDNPPIVKEVAFGMRVGKDFDIQLSFLVIIRGKAAAVFIEGPLALDEVLCGERGVINSNLIFLKGSLVHFIPLGNDIPQNSYKLRFKYGEQAAGLQFKQRMKIKQLSTLLFVLLALAQAAQTQGESALPPSCLSMNSSTKQCTTCRDHYHLWSGVCYIDILGCEDYLNGNICRKCENGFILVNNECCDKLCMNKAFLQLQNSIRNQENKDEAKRKAEIQGYEKAASVVAKNSIKIGQTYDIISTKSQFFEGIFRYQISIQIQSKRYIALVDYNIETKQASLVDLSPSGKPVEPEITLNEENIHSNSIYERGYKFIYIKYGLDLYEMEFSRMTAIKYDRTTELKFVFIGGQKVVLISIVVAEEDTYTLWKEEKTNVDEIKEYISTLKQIEVVSRDPSFIAVYNEVLTQRQLTASDVDILEITQLSKEEYVFTIYVRSLRIRFVIRGSFNSKTKTTNIKKIEEVISTKLQEIKVPENAEVKIIDKASISSNTEAKEVFDYMYKVRPSFRQTQVETVKIETGSETKKIIMMEKKDGKDYRIVLLKDINTNELQLVDETLVVSEAPTTTIIQTQNDGTSSIITNKVDYSHEVTKTIINTLTKNNIDTSSSKIESIQTVEGPKSIEYTLVLGDLLGKPTKQVTVIQSKETNQTTVIDITSLEGQIQYIATVPTPITQIPASQFYKPEIKDLVSLIELNSKEAVTVSTIKSITVSNSTLFNRYELVVENARGEEVNIIAVQDKNDKSVQVLQVETVEEEVSVVQNVQTINKKTVNEYGVSIEFTNDVAAIKSDQSSNIALNFITSQLTQYQDYEVVSSYSKTFTQTQEHTLILSDGSRQVQVTGNIDLKSLRYIPIEHKEVPISILYPSINQNTIPAAIYPSYIREHKEVKDSEAALVEKYKIFKGKTPSSTVIEQFTEVIKTTFNYEIGAKKFVAVVDYNTLTSTAKILEMNPVQQNVVPVVLETKEIRGETITISNSISEIKSVNSNTEAVISTVTAEYPLMKKYNISNIQVVQSKLTDTFEITYQDQSTGLSTTITVVSGKSGQNVAIQDIYTGETASQAQPSETTTVVVSTQEYESKQIKEITSFVKESGVKFDSILKITADTTPGITTYNLQVLQNNKKYDVSLVQVNQKMEVVAVRTSTETANVVSINTEKTDDKGNTIIQTNNQTTIANNVLVQDSLREIIKKQTYLQNYQVQFVQTTNYGDVQEIIMTLENTEVADQTVQSVVYYDQSTKVVNVVSVRPFVPQIEVAAPTMPIQFVPGFAIPNVIKTDVGLKTVITTVQTTSTELTKATVVSSEVQPISDSITKYTVLFDLGGQKTQTVHLYDSKTQKTTAVTESEVTSVSASYLTTTVKDEQTVISSNNIIKIAEAYPSVQQIIDYSKQKFDFIPEGSVISYVSVAPSQSSTTYVLEVTTSSETKVITVNKDSESNHIRLVDYKLEEKKPVYPVKPAPIYIDVKEDKTLVDSYIGVIEGSNDVSLQTVKEIVSIKKEVSQTYEKVYLEVVNLENIKYYVTILSNNGEKPIFISSVPEVQEISEDTGIQITQVNEYGNVVTQTTKIIQITNDYEAQISLKQIIKSNQEIKNLNITSMKKIYYGTAQEIQFTFANEDTEQLLQSIVYYDQSTKVINVVSVRPFVPQTEVSAPTKPIQFVPGFAIPNVIKTDVGLKTVITTVQTTSTELTKATVVSSQVQPISDSITKYTVLFDLGGQKTQTVHLYDSTTQKTTTVTVVAIESISVPVYVSQQTTEDGIEVTKTNNITFISSVYPDFKDVTSFVSTSTGATVTTSNTNIEVVSKSTIHTYTLTIRGQQQTQSVVVNYDLSTNKCVLVNYDQSNVIQQAASIDYTEVKSTAEQRTAYISWLKASSDAAITNVVNILSIQRYERPLYVESILEIQTQTQSSVFVTIIKRYDSNDQQVISVYVQPQQGGEQPTDAAGETGSGEIGSGGETGSFEGEGQTAQTTDNNGNTVTESTDSTFISNSQVIKTTYTQIVQSVQDYQDYSIKYIKTVDYGEKTQVVLTLQSLSPSDAPVQVLAYYDEKTKQVSVISHQAITQSDVTILTSIPKPQVQTQVVTGKQVTEIVKVDSEFKSVITKITTKEEFKQGTVISVEVNSFSPSVTQYNTIVDVLGSKKEVVSLVNKTSNVVTHISTSNIPTVIVPSIYSETKVQEQTVVISNNVETVTQSYPQTQVVFDTFIKQNPTVAVSSINSVIVSTESQATTVSIFTNNTQGTSIIVNKFIATESGETTKVDSVQVPVINIIQPKPFISTPIPTIEIEKNAQIVTELIKIINSDTKNTLETTKITSVVKSEQTNVHVYTITTLNSKNENVNVQIVYNPSTEVVKSVDIGHPIDASQKVVTQTVVQEYTGKTEVTTSNIATITETKEYKKITDFINKNHPESISVISSPVMETTEKYQRASIKTLVFSEGTQTVQGTYIIDQRTNSTIELHYNVVNTVVTSRTSLPIVIPTSSYTSPEAIALIVQSNEAVIATLKVIEKVDFSLSSSSIIFIEIRDYTTAATITILYETASSNSRILAFYNPKTLESKVVDYTKVAKVIQSSKTIEQVNQYGQTTVFTTNTKTITTTEEFTKVYSFATQLVPTINNKEIRGVETVVKQNSKEYTIITMDNGIINHVRLQTNIKTGEITFVSSSQTPVASEVLAVIPRPQQKTRLTIETLQSTQITEIRKEIATQLSIKETEATIVSGSVTKNNLVQTYNVVVQTSNKSNQQIRIVKSLQTNQLTVSNIKPVVFQPVQPIKTITTQNIYGHIETISNNYTEITTSEETETVIRTIRRRRPQFINAIPISSKTVQYGQITEITLIFTDEWRTSQYPVQITTTTNKKTGTVEVLDTRQISIKESTIKGMVNPIIPIQVIPAPAIAVATRKMPEITQIITSVQSVTKTKIETLTVEDYGNVKKYIAIVPKDAGKQEFVYYFDKTTLNVQTVQTRFIESIQPAVTYSQHNNQFGESVITSSSVQQISVKVPEVTKAFNVLTEQYTTSVTSTIKSIESKGTTTKQIKFIAVDAANVETVYTVLADSSSATVIDAKKVFADLSAPVAKEEPVYLGEEGVRVDSAQKKEIESVINSNADIKSTFTSTTIQSIQVINTAFTQQYVVTVKDTDNKVANVTLIRNPGESIQVISVDSAEFKKTVNQTESFTQTVTSSVTGEVRVITTDQASIQKDKTTQQITAGLIKVQPSLAGWQTVSTQTSIYGDVVQTVLVLQSASEVPVQAITTYNITSQKVTVLDIKKITTVGSEHTVLLPTIEVQTIPAAVIETASKKHSEITTIISQIQSVTTSTTKVETLSLEDLGTVKKYIAIVPTETGKQQYIYYYDKTTNKIRDVTNFNIPEEIKVINVEESVTKWGEKVIISNSIETITKKYTETTQVIETINTYLNKPIQAVTESIQVSNQNGALQFKVVVQIDAKYQQITVVKQVDGLKIINIQTLPESMGEEGTEGPSTPQTEGGETGSVSSDSQTGSQIAQVISTNSNLLSESSKIVSINSTQTLVSTVYTVSIKDASNVISVVRVLEQPGEPLSLISAVEHSASSVVSTQEIISTKEISSVTGQQITLTNDVKVIKAEENKVYIAAITKQIPSLIKVEPTAVQTIAFGNFIEKTFILEQQEQQIQVTTLYNKTSETYTVLDSKNLTAKVDEVITKPITYINVIPGAIIQVTAKKITEIKDIISDIRTITKKDVVLESLTVEDYGNIKKYIAVLPTPTLKQQFVYIFDKKTKTITLIDTFTVPLQIESFVYEQTVNKYGEKVIQSTSVTEVVASIPDVSSGIHFITTKYPSITEGEISFIKTIQYPTFYQTEVVTGSSQNALTVVVNIDKQTKTVKQISTYSQSDIVTQESIQTVTSTKQAETLNTTSTIVKNVVKFIEASKDIPVDHVQTVVSAQSQTTIYGNEIITAQVVSSDKTKVEVVMNYNTSSKQITVKTYDVIEVAKPVEGPIITEFKVDTVTGTKITTTNDTTVIASSEITTNLVTEMKVSYPKVAQEVILSSTTVEYPDKVKVITVFEDSTSSSNVTQVTSIYDKSTASVTIIETQSVDYIKLQAAPTSERQIYTNTEIKKAETTITSVSETTTYIQKEYPIYISQTPSTVIVEQLNEVDIVTYLYETSAETKTQLVLTYNKTSQESSVIESSIIPKVVEAFFYEEKTNQNGQTVVITNNLTEVIQRVPKTQMIKTYLIEELKYAVSQVKTVETVVGTTHNEYTLVIETGSGLKQIQLLANLETEQVKIIDEKVLPAINNVIQPTPRPYTGVNPQDEGIRPLITEMIESPETNLTEINSIISIFRQEVSETSRYEIEYVNKEDQTIKLIVQQDQQKKPTIVDERYIVPQFVQKEPIVIAEKIDGVTKTSEVMYSSLEVFKTDAKASEIIKYTLNNVQQIKNYTIESVKKEVYGQIQSYDILYKSPEKAPFQVTIVNDKTNNNLLLLETKRITEPEQKSVLESSIPNLIAVEVTDIEKENIKVLSKLGLVKDIKEYDQASVTKLSQNEQFVTATEAVKQSYSVLLKQSVIIKVLEKKSLESDSVKVFFKAKDQIFEASIEMNPITGESKLTDFIKIGTQATVRSEVNVYSDLCYGYQTIEDISLDSNIDFLVDYLKKKYEALRDASLNEAQSIVLESGRINYKLYFKKDSQTVKYIVYYQPEYKRVLEVRGSSFSIGEKYNFVPRDQQISDPYFRKLDTYLRQNRGSLNSASVLHTQNKDDGQSIQFRTVYSSEGKTYRSVAEINKENQNINEITLNEIIEIPTSDSPTDIGENDEAYSITKLDIHDLGKNLYFTEAHRVIQTKYQKELENGQLLGASEKSNLFSFIFKEFYMINDKIITVSAQYNPATQQASISSELTIIDIQEGYFPVRSDRKLTEVRNWLKEKNLDLSAAVMVSSMSKQILFGTAYKIVFKDMTKFYTYVVYYDNLTREMRVLLDKDSSSAQPSQGEGEQVGESGGEDIAVASQQPRLKGFARPNSKSSTTQ